MFPKAQQSITMRSRPSPQPPCGNAPYLKDYMQSLRVQSLMPHSTARVDRNSGSWIRCAPLEISSPRMKMSQEQVQRGSSSQTMVQKGLALMGYLWRMQKSVSYFSLTMAPSFFQASVLRSSKGSIQTPCCLSSQTPSAKVIFTTGYLYLKGSKGNCSLIAASSLPKPSCKPLKIEANISPIKSKTSVQCQQIAIQISRPMNQVACLCENEFQALKTGAISNTLVKSLRTLICLQS